MAMVKLKSMREETPESMQLGKWWGQRMHNIDAVDADDADDTTSIYNSLSF